MNFLPQDAFEMLVIDDGSVDDTVAVAIEAGATVISHPFNLGVGAALRTGFRYARDTGVDAVVQVDADGQHEVADAIHLLDAVSGGEADLAVGSRFARGYKVSFGRRTSMRIQVDAWKRARVGGPSFKAAEGLFVYVAIDEKGHPRPVPAE